MCSNRSPNGLSSGYPSTTVLTAPEIQGPDHLVHTPRANWHLMTGGGRGRLYASCFVRCDARVLP